MVGMVGKADAAVIVWPEIDPDTQELLALVKAKGLPVHLVELPRGDGSLGKNRGGSRCGW